MTHIGKIIPEVLSNIIDRNFYKENSMLEQRVSQSVKSIDYLFQSVFTEGDTSALFEQCTQRHGDSVVSVSTHKFTAEALQHIQNVLPVVARQHFKDALNNGHRIKNRNARSSLLRSAENYGEASVECLTRGLVCVLKHRMKSGSGFAQVADMIVAIKKEYPRLSVGFESTISRGK
jgi:hypothetical protein